MDFWLVLAGFFSVVIFLCCYHDWLRKNKKLTPLKIGRLISMVLVIICFFNAIDGKGVLYVLFTIAMFAIIYALNVAEAGALHGTLMTLWQLFASAVAVIIWAALRSERIAKTPNGKEKK